MRNRLLIAVMALIMPTPLVLAEETGTPTERRALSPAELDSVKGGQVDASVATAISGVIQQNVVIVTNQQVSVSAPDITVISLDLF
jgi:hypothetical protein